MSNDKHIEQLHEMREYYEWLKLPDRVAAISAAIRALSPAGGDWGIYERFDTALRTATHPTPADEYGPAINSAETYSKPIADTSGQTPTGAGGELALNVRHPKCHEAANAFWNYWNANGETHRHGYYESTWGAINQALRVVGVIPHDYGDAAQPDGKRSMGPEKQPPEPRTDCVWPNCACDQPSKKCGEESP